MTNVSFDLVDIIRTIQKKKVFIIIMTVIGLLLAGVFLMIRKDKFKGESSFFVNNPLYTDRSTLFRSIETRYVDYFGGDDDVDKIMALANADTVKDRIIRNCQFQTIYNRDINDPKGHADLMRIFAKNFNCKRTEFKSVEVSYIAYDAKTAADVTNMAVKVLEETYRNYYVYMKGGIYTSIKSQVTRMDSTINVLTDSLAIMRDRYGIYSIISPARQNMISSDVKGGGKGYGKAIEEIQNVESIKDQLVTDRAHYISVLNEFEATESSAMDFLKVMTRATPPTGPTGPGASTILIAAALLAMFFSILYTLLMAYFGKLNAVIR
jgi:hypothetical protein